MGNKNPNKSTRFQPGVSGNPNGRPKGKTGKWSNARIAEEFSKGTKTAMDTIFDLMQSDKETGATRMRAALGWLVEQDKANKRAIEDTFNKIKLEQERISLELSKEKLKEKQNPSSDKPENKEDDNTPVLSLKAIAGGKE